MPAVRRPASSAVRSWGVSASGAVQPPCCVTDVLKRHMTDEARACLHAIHVGQQRQVQPAAVHRYVIGPPAQLTVTCHASPGRRASGIVRQLSALTGATDCILLHLYKPRQEIFYMCTYFSHLPIVCFLAGMLYSIMYLLSKYFLLSSICLPADRYCSMHGVM